MKKVLIIALNTFKENLRDKILYNLLVFGLLLIGSSVLISTLTMGEQERIIKDIGLASINLLGVMISIFVGIGLISKEIEKRTIYTIIAKPVPRYQFLLGRYVGLAITLFVNVAIMTIGFISILWLRQITPDVGLLQAIELIFVELLIIVAVAVMFSAFTTPTLSAIFTLAIYVIGHLTGDLKVLGEKLHGGAVQAVFDTLYYTLPNLEHLNVKGQAAYGVPIEPGYVLEATCYGLLYATIVMGLACIIFQRRDF